MGFRLIQNFDRPFASRSIAELWRRWHISLSTWFRDYVFLPLCGHRVSRQRWALVVLIVFLLSGLWHGAAWTFVLWGALHGCYIVAERFTQAPRDRLAAASGLLHWPRLRASGQVLTTFTLFTVALVLFRTTSLEHARVFYLHLLSGWSDLGQVAGLRHTWEMMDPKGIATLGLVGLAGLIVAEFMARESTEPLLGQHPWWARWSMYYVVTGALVFQTADVTHPFIYFQF